MQPIIKWAGGKRQLLDVLKTHMPSKYNKYVEPFFGSGALFFDLMPENAIVNDFNVELVNLYQCVRDSVDDVLRVALRYQHEYNALLSDEERKLYYYARREDFNRNIHNQLGVTDAALFLFLNKACYNGLYRVNSNGFYNTPYGQRKKLTLCTEDHLKECSRILKNTVVLSGDFETACCDLVANDFVYFDSPYYDTFDTYQSGGFPVSEHERLATLFKRLSDSGVYCMLSNSDTPYIKSLYADFNISVIPVKRMINCNGEKRTGSEVIITNY